MSQVKINIVVDQYLQPLNPQQEKLIEQFLLYKQTSLQESDKNFINPAIGVQRAYPSSHPSFGRDTEFEHPPHLINDIHEHHLSKVHVDTRRSWQPHRKQWFCTSNESIVYSGFKKPCGMYCFVILEFLINAEDDDFDAHGHYTDDDIDYYLDAAAENRDEILGNG